MGILTFRLNKGLKIADKSKPHSVYFRYQHGRAVDFNASLGKNCRVPFNNWNKDKQKVVGNIKGKTSINGLITRLSAHFDKFDEQVTRSGVEPTYELVREHYNKFFTKPEKVKIEPVKKELFAYFERFINDSITAINPQTNKPVSSSTIKSYWGTYNHLKRFNDEVARIDFDGINKTFYKEYVAFCEMEDLSSNYIGKHIKVLKTVMRSALENGITANKEFLSRSFVVLREKSDHIFLSEDELKKMYELNLSEHPRHDLARDLFLIGAYTGLRVSDYNTLTKENIKSIEGVKMLVLKTRKINNKVAIPLRSTVVKILDKHNGVPKRLPDQHINKLIKDVGEWCGIDEVVETKQRKGGKQLINKHMKFELIKTHTARRSFCTNGYLAGVPVIDLMSASGHTSEKTFLNYICAEPEQRAIKTSQHPFFNQ